MPTIFSRSLPTLLLALALAHPLLAHEAAHHDAAPAPRQVAADMADAARKFLDSLSPEQLAIAKMNFNDDERMNWFFIPRKRLGLTLKDMSPAQRELARAMLKTGLSEKGAGKLLAIMSLEQILGDIEKTAKGPLRDPEMYYWSIFGTPGHDQPWGWRVEGHHASVQFTIVATQGVAAGPAFLGSNPAEVKSGPHKGLRVLAEEEDQGRALITSLSDAQRKKAIIDAKAPKDILTGNQRQVLLKEFQGIPASELTAPQQAALMELLGVYAHRLRKELAEDDLRRIAHAGIASIHFAWAGGLAPGEGHYYRLHGPTFLVEYDNTQNNANHVHSVWRDLQNDFGGDLLKRHYQTSPHHQH